MSTKSPWIAFAECIPEEVAAIDDPNVKVMPRVMVTNNINARDRMGQPSHVWYAMPILSQSGEWVAFDEGGRGILSLTHWFDPFQ